MTNWSEYAYQSNDGGMIILLLILGAIMIYLLFSKGFWLDRFMQSRKWEGHDIEPEKIPTKKPKKPRKNKTKRVYKKRSKK